MRPTDNIEDAISKLNFKPNADLGKRTIRDAIAAQTNCADPAHSRVSTWRTIMKSPVTTFTVAAAAMVVIGVSIYYLDKSNTVAYAIEQTIQANQKLTYVHFSFVPYKNDLKKEAWIMYDENGRLKKLRVDMYNTGGPGTKWIQVWSEGTTIVWYENQNIVDYFDCNSLASKQMFKFVEHLAPREAVDYLYRMEQEGKDQIIIEQNSNNEIRVKGQYPKGMYLIANPQFPPCDDILVVDHNSKLVTKLEVYKDGVFVGSWDNYDYQPFDPNIFEIEKEIPAEAVKIIEYPYSDANTVGMDKASLTEEGFAQVVIPEFFNALIAKDYTKAGQLFGGMPADEAELQFGKFNVVRLASIENKVGKTANYPDYYPCIVEIDEDGSVSEWHPKIFIGPVYNCPLDHWRISAIK